MEEKFWKIAGFWGMGLILIVETLIIIRWAIDFVTWSAIDSGWAQVLGSIAALGVAIFIMARQNANAARLLRDADRQASLRRARSVHAIMINCWNTMMLIRPFSETVAPPELTEFFANRLKKSPDVMTEIIATLRAIPLHDLGSYELVQGLHYFIDNASMFRDEIESLAEAPTSAGSENVIKSNAKKFQAMDGALNRFMTGINNLFD